MADLGKGGPRRFHLSNSQDLRVHCDLAKGILYKPAGCFWYDIDGDWIRWVLSEQPDWLRLYLYEVTVCEERVLRICSMEELLRFQATFHVPILPGLSRYSDTIDWSAVAERWGGVEIAPYQWRHRCESVWYYGWDCASGVIWDAQAVTSVRLVAEGEKEITAFAASLGVEMPA